MEKAPCTISECMYLIYIYISLSYMGIYWVLNVAIWRVGIYVILNIFPSLTILGDRCILDASVILLKTSVSKPLNYRFEIESDDGIWNNLCVFFPSLHAVIGIHSTTRNFLNCFSDITPSLSTLPWKRGWLVKFWNSISQPSIGYWVPIYRLQCPNFSLSCTIFTHKIRPDVVWEGVG